VYCGYCGSKSASVADVKKDVIDQYEYFKRFVLGDDAGTPDFEGVSELHTDLAKVNGDFGFDGAYSSAARTLQVYNKQLGEAIETRSSSVIKDLLIEIDKYLDKLGVRKG
jgi:hypothetical protein